MFRSLLRTTDVQLSCPTATNIIRLILFQLILILTHAAVQVTQYLITPRESANSFILLIGLYIVCISMKMINLVSLILLAYHRQKLEETAYLIADFIALLYLAVQFFQSDLNYLECDLTLLALFQQAQCSFVFKTISYSIFLVKLFVSNDKDLMMRITVSVLITLILFIQLTKLKYQQLENSHTVHLSQLNSFYEAIFEIFSNEKNLGIFIPDQNFQEKFSQEIIPDVCQKMINKPEFIKFPISVNQLMVCTSVPSVLKERYIKQKFDNLYHFLEQFDIILHHRTQIFAKNKSRGLKYALLVRSIQTKQTKTKVVFFFNISGYVCNEKMNRQMKKFQSQLTSALTHKLKTPLSSALTHLTSAVNDECVSQQIKSTYIVPSFQNCQLQLYQVQDILDFISVEIDQQYPQVKHIDIVAVTQRVVEIISSSCKNKQIDLKFTINKLNVNRGQSIFFYTDENKLSRILINLLNNAYRFTQQGGFILLDISCHDTLAATFTVQDSGYGMSEDQFEQINKELSQQFIRRLSVQPSQREVQNVQFTGISLQITNLLVKMLNNMGSPLNLLKSDSHGTKFEFSIDSLQDSPCPLTLKSLKNIDQFRTYRSISIPNNILQQGNNLLIPSNNLIQPGSASKKQKLSNFSLNKVQQQINRSKSFELYSSLEEVSQEPSGQPLLNSTRVNCGLKGVSTSNYSRLKSVHHSSQDLGNNLGKILIVDDEPFNHVSLSMMLKNLKCNAIESSYNGAECLDKVRRMDGCIRAVLMDVDMPIMDGVQAAQQIVMMQKSQQLCMFPIIGCTAHQDEETHQECLDAGMVAVLTKPIFMKQLHEVIKLIEAPIESQNRLSSRNFY